MPLKIIAIPGMNKPLTVDISPTDTEDQKQDKIRAELAKQDDQVTQVQKAMRSDALSPKMLKDVPGGTSPISGQATPEGIDPQGMMDANQQSSGSKLMALGTAAVSSLPYGKVANPMLRALLSGGTAIAANRGGQALQQRSTAPLTAMPNANDAISGGLGALGGGVTAALEKKAAFNNNLNSIRTNNAQLQQTSEGLAKTIQAAREARIDLDATNRDLTTWRQLNPTKVAAAGKAMTNAERDLIQAQKTAQLNYNKAIAPAQRAALQLKQQPTPTPEPTPPDHSKTIQMLEKAIGLGAAGGGAAGAYQLIKHLLKD